MTAPAFTRIRLHPEAIYKVSEICNALSYERHTIERHLRAGTLEGEKLSGEWRIRGADALAWCGAQKTQRGERDMPKAFSVKTLAERWDCSTRLVYQMIDDGDLKAFPLGKRGLRICADEVNRCESLIAKSSNIEDSDSGDEATPTLPTTAMKTAVADARN